MWSIDLARRRRRSRTSAGPSPSERPRPEAAAETGAILLVSPDHGREIVARRCERAAAAGIAEGMTLSHARALIAGASPHVERHCPERDAAALEALSQWALQFSPIVAPDPPDGLLLDIGGCERLFHGEGNLISRLLEAVRRLGFHARAASAPTFGCAWAAARFGGEPCAIVTEDQVRASLARLPVEALRVGEDTAEAMAEIGIRTIGHLFDLPRSSLRRRFGGDLLLRLDQATGTAWETIEPVRPRVLPQAERAFAGPVRDGEAIQLVARDLLDRLCAQLDGRQSGAFRIDLELARSDIEPVTLSVSLSGPSRDSDHLWALIRPQLERAHLGFGVEKMTLTAARTALMPHEQTDYLGDPKTAEASRQDRRFSELLDLMVNRLGPDRVTQVEAAESHIPERAFHRRPAVRPRPRRRPRACVRGGDRPSLLFERPEPAEVITVRPDGPLVWLRWRGRERRILSTAGPERISPEWWRSRARLDAPGSDAATRDYFKVQDDGGTWLWVYRELETGRWFVHGQWA